MPATASLGQDDLIKETIKVFETIVVLDKTHALGGVPAAEDGNGSSFACTCVASTGVRRTWVC